MNYTQNYKIAQVAESTMIVGVDIGSLQVAPHNYTVDNTPARMVK